MSWTLCASGQAVLKAGTHCNSTIATSGQALAYWSDEAEADVCFETNTDWTTYYSDLSTNAKNALADLVSSKIAMKIISYDPTGYLAREADMLMNFNDEIVTRKLNALRGKADRLKTP